ncbi:MAG: AAA family ATPase [Cetobacterium sp.]
MIVNKRDKKLGRVNRSEAILTLKSKYAKPRLSDNVEQRIKAFCISKNIQPRGNYTIIKKYADMKMCLDSQIAWEDYLTKNPWDSLMSAGNTFKSADKIGMLLGFKENDPNRLIAYVQKALEDTTKGSTILPLLDIIKVMMRDLNIEDMNNIAQLIFESNNKGFLLLDSAYKRVTDSSKSRFITKLSWYNAEKDWYLLLRNLTKFEFIEIPKTIKSDAKNSHPYILNDKQSWCVDSFDRLNINILNGSGGTGKTSVMKSIMVALKKSRQSYTCLAPTGIASKMFREATGFNCVTVHSRCTQSSDFIETDWLILEEFGMYSVVHINLILSKLDMNNPPRILMLGDTGQLQPICAGSIFRDTIRLINSGKIKGNIMTLTEIMRAKEDTFIPYLCQMFTGEGRYNSSIENVPHNNVYFHKLGSDLSKQIIELFEAYALRVEDTYVLSPMNKGDFGNTKLNSELDYTFGGDILYRDSYKVYRKDSIYMHTKNNRELGIYNGEKIKLHNVNNSDFSCSKLYDDEDITYDYDVFKTETQLSYCNSFYKVQGLTTKNVIVILSKHHSFMLTREAVYTALSRASEKLIIVYDDGMLSRAGKNMTIESRVTFLGEISKI